MRMSRWVALLVALCAGCVTAEFEAPVASFRESINSSGALIASYYTEMNQLERDVYLDAALYDSALEVGWQHNGEPTPLAGAWFSAASIQARRDAIALLGVYVERLQELAGSDAPARFQQGAKALGENLEGLAGTFGSLAGRADATGRTDSTAVSYVGPVTSLIGVVGNLYLEQVRERALTSAIQEGAPAVRAILDQLRADLAAVIQPAATTALLQRLSNRVLYYNAHRTDGLDERRLLLQDIGEAAHRYEVALVANPASLVENMKGAHEALVAYSQSPRKIEDLADLVAALRTFESYVAEAAAAVAELRGTDQEGR